MFGLHGAKADLTLVRHCARTFLVCLIQEADSEVATQLAWIHPMFVRMALMAELAVYVTFPLA